MKERPPPLPAGEGWGEGGITRTDLYACRPTLTQPSPASGRGLFVACLLPLLALYAVRVAEDAHLAAPDPTPIVTDRSGAFLTQAGHTAQGRTEYGYWTTPPPERVVAATLALEDRRFWQHPGVDPAAILRAAWSRLHGGHSGASTLAMQVARMQHPRPRTLWAKAVEAGTAVALTARYGRAAVLAHYLRLAPYGQGSHGIGHAARWFLDKPAADLTWAEAALLAAVPQAPALANLRRDSGLVRARIRAARALAVLDVPQAERAALTTLRPIPAPQRPGIAMHVALRLARLAPHAAFDPADARLRAALDLAQQSNMSRIARAQLRHWQSAGAQQVAVMVVRRATGEVLADIGSAGWHSRPGGQIDFSAALRSPGSTLKPFLYGLALDRGQLTPDEVMADLPDGAAGFVNADHAFLGALLPRQALANSRNVPATNLLRRIGLETGFDFLREAGLHRLDGTAERFGLGLALGALPSSLDKLMPAYAMLARDGVLRDLVWLLAQAPPSGKRLLSEPAARQIQDFLSDPLARLPSFPRYGASEYPFPVALKTGTSQGYRDAWTIAWSDQYVVGAWIGRTDAGSMAGLTGGRTAARLVQAVLLGLHGAGRTDLRAGSFAAPAGQLSVALCTGTGRPVANEPCAGQLTEWVAAGTAPARAPPRLRITHPEPDQHVWRNPEAPAALNRLVLRAAAEPPVAQLVWLVDGQPVAVLASDQPYHWPLSPGRHRFEVRLPLEAASSASVRVVVE